LFTQLYPRPNIATTAAFSPFTRRFIDHYSLLSLFQTFLKNSHSWCYVCHQWKKPPRIVRCGIELRIIEDVPVCDTTNKPQWTVYSNFLICTDRTGEYPAASLEDGDLQYLIMKLHGQVGIPDKCLAIRGSSRKE
jgi:hypothetical protein